MRVINPTPVNNKIIPNPKTLKVISNDQIRGGNHANIVSVTTTGNKEVIFDFIFAHPNDKNEKGEVVGQLVSRVILPLSVAQEFRLVLDTHMGRGVKE